MRVRELPCHSTLDQALRFAEATGVGRLVTFHHDPDHGDDLLDGLLASALSRHPGLDVCPGTEGACFSLVAER